MDQLYKMYWPFQAICLVETYGDIIKLNLMLKFVLTSFPKDLYHANYVLAGMEFVYRFSEHKDCWGVWDTQAGASEVY